MSEEIETEALSQTASGQPPEAEPENERVLYGEFRELTEGQPLIDSLRNAVLVFGGLQTFVFIPADAILFPDHFEFFLIARLAQNALLALVYFKLAHTYPVASSALVMFSGAALFQGMVHVTGGVESGYYVGTILLVIGMGVLAPISGRQATAITGVIFAGYMTVPWVSHAADAVIAWPAFFQSAFFLGTACAESTLACVYMDRMRFIDFRQKRELERARDELAELDRAKSRFSANVHHELRTPLTLILAPLDSMRAGDFGDLPTDVRSVLDTMHANGRRLYRMINNLLDLSKLENSQFSVVRRPTNIARLVDELVMAARPLADSKQVVLEASGLDSLPEINVDPEAIEKVFVNLVGNALKFTEAGGVVRVSGRSEGEGLSLDVRDSGIGIPSSQLESVFDRFAQVDSSATRRYEGTGIGLALAKEMVELHGGQIWAESGGLGHGTTMKIWLPLGEQDEVGEEEVLRTQTGSILGLTHSMAAVEADLMIEGDGDGDSDGDFASVDSGIEGAERPEILIAEDNPDMRALLASIVSRHYRVRTARNGREALEAVRDALPDLVLSDVMMPEMSGTDLCRAIKENPETSALPVVLVTSKAENEMKIEGLELGADDYITKPFHPRELMARISGLVRVSMLQRALAIRNDQLEQTLDELKQAEVQLVQSERLAAVGELAAGIAHEVNNPVNFALNAVRAMDGVVREFETAIRTSGSADDQNEMDTLLELCGIINEGLMRTHSLVSDLRDFATPGRKAGARVATSLERGLKSTLHLLARGVADAEIELDVDIEDPLPPVQADAGAINQVILNLMKNAVQALGRGGRVGVRLWRDGDCLHLSVTDNGPGVALADQSRLFDPFFTTKDPGEGTGLGLSISRQIAVDHGGRLEVESAPGEGATFILSLPVA